MYETPIFELALIGVFDANLPNLERVVLRPMQSVDLGNFGLGVGFTGADGLIYPLGDNVFWFPRQTVRPPSWLFVYTGVGQQRETHLEHSAEPALVMHWQRQTTIFNLQELVPILFRRDAVIVGQQIQRPST